MVETKIIVIFLLKKMNIMPQRLSDVWKIDLFREKMSHMFALARKNQMYTILVRVCKMICISR